MAPVFISLLFILAMHPIFTSRAFILSFCLLAIGGIGLCCIRLFGHRFFKKAADKRYQPSHRALYLVVFGGVVIFLKNVDISWQHYHQAGFFIVAYSICRFILSVFLIILCFTLGALTLRRFFPSLRQDKVGGELSYFILCFFGGASIYAIVFTLLGLLGFLKTPAALLLTAPLLFFSPPLISQVMKPICAKISRVFCQLEGISGWARALLVWLALVAGGFLFFSKGLYPGPFDNDVWEHYLPYYREVLRNGSLGPNEIWFQFYISKAAGLFYLSSLLSDCLSVQLVSWCFILVTGIILFQFLNEHLADFSWALLGVIVFFAACAYRDSGNFFKHHTVLAGYVVFLVWASIQIIHQALLPRKAFYLFMAAASFYIGFHQPQGSAILVVFWGITTCSVVLFRAGRPLTHLFATLFLFVVMGIITDLVLGYAFTGLATLDPVHFFWPLADCEKFDRVFGASSIAYSLFSEPHVQRQMNLDWSFKIFRCEYFFSLFPTPILLLGGIIGISKMIQPVSRIRIQHDKYPMLLFAIFAFSSFVLGQLMTTQSVLHLFMFNNFIMAVIGIASTKIVVDTFIPRVVKPWFCVLLFVFLSLGAVTQGLRYTGETRLKALAAYTFGRWSFCNVLQETSAYFKHSLEAVVGIRQLLGPHARIISLTRDAGPGYSFPGAGIVSEPSHTLGTHYLEIVFGTPDQAKGLLQKRGFDYFLVNLNRPLFSGLVFSHLFAPDHLNPYFKVIFQEGDNYLLTWRLPEDTETIPQRLAQTLELKQRGVLFYPFSTEFGSRVQSAMSCESPALSVAAITQFLQDGMTDSVVLKENQVFLRSLISQVEQMLKQEIPRLVSQVWERNNIGLLEESTRLKVINQELSVLTVDGVKKFIILRYEERFGRELTLKLVSEDERIPYGYFYKSEEDFNAFLKRGKPP